MPLFKLKRSKEAEEDKKEDKTKDVAPKSDLKKESLLNKARTSVKLSLQKTRDLTKPKETITTSPMAKIMEEIPSHPEVGDLVEGPVIAIERASIFIDIPPFGTGIIFGREFIHAQDIIRKTNVGDIVAAKVVEKENEDGYIELSLREARRALVWSEAEEAIKNKTIFEIVVKEANKGGLMLEWQGIVGFLPASQLKAEHYPRVEGGSKEKVLVELQKFVGTKLHVSILAISPQEEKLIFSEKEPEQKEKSEMVEKYKIGDVVEGEITGIVDFGLFLKIEENLEGLVHISEMDWGLVDDPNTLFTVGEKVKAQIIEIKDGKISLSIKALRENPWVEASKKYKRGDTVTGVVIKYNKHGALISVEEGVAGLVHISEFENEEQLRETLELGKSYSVIITLFEPNEQRMTLSYKKVDEKIPDKEDKEKE